MEIQFECCQTTKYPKEPKLLEYWPTVCIRLTSSIKCDPISAHEGRSVTVMDYR